MRAYSTERLPSFAGFASMRGPLPRPLGRVVVSSLARHSCAQLSASATSLRQRMIDDMNMRHFGRETQRNYVRDVGRFATFLGRPPDTATAEDLRRFQVEQREAGMSAPTMNSIVSALRFFFTQTLDRPDLARRLVRVSHPRKLPVVLSRDEVARLLGATTCLKHQAALSVAYGAGLRVGEVSMLKVRDVDSERMLLRVEHVVRAQQPQLLRVDDTRLADHLEADLWEFAHDPCHLVECVVVFPATLRVQLVLDAPRRLDAA